VILGSYASVACVLNFRCSVALFSLGRLSQVRNECVSKCGLSRRVRKIGVCVCTCIAAACASSEDESASARYLYKAENASGHTARDNVRLGRARATSAHENSTLMQMVALTYLSANSSPRIRQA